MVLLAEGKEKYPQHKSLKSVQTTCQEQSVATIKSKKSRGVNRCQMNLHIRAYCNSLKLYGLFFDKSILQNQESVYINHKNGGMTN